MCGIIGVIGHNGYDYINRNIGLLEKRGPDSFGVLQITNKLTLGATRLAMVDPLPRSNQPFTDSQDKNVIVFNGEIYNYRKLKKLLISMNIEFKSESDTEVLLEAINLFGPMFIKNLEGMFAFAFYDRSKDKLILARDYLGKKPLFYSLGKDYLIFSSQMNVIKKYIKNYSIDNSTLSNYLKLGYVISPKTMFREIKAVMPGEYIEIDVKTNSILSRNNFIPSQIINPDANEINVNLETAFEERIQDHSSFALSMSGGIDSTILALIARNLGKKFQAYTMHWNESDKDRYNKDAKAAELICKQLGIEHIRVEMAPLKSVPQLLNQYVIALGEPNSNPSGVSMMALYREISKNDQRLVITGDGADEIFGGYERYLKINRLNMLRNLNLNSLHKAFSFTKSTQISNSKILIAMSNPKSHEFWTHWQSLTSNSYLSNFYVDFENNQFELFENDYKKILKTKNVVASTMFRDLKIWLSMESNNKLDRISMNYSIEARSPFQSERVIGSALAQMQNTRFKKLEKTILTELYPELNYLPINKTKLGFISPLGHWMRANPELIQKNLEIIKLNFEFNRAELSRLGDSPKHGTYADFRFLWNLLVLAEWTKIE